MLEGNSHVVSGVSLALCIAVLVIFFLGLDLDKRWRLRHIPGPPALPFLGNLRQIMKLGSPTFFRQCRAKYGAVFKVAFGRTWAVVVADPELQRQVGTRVLNHPVNRTFTRAEFERLDKFGLLAARDDYWRHVRSAWQPAFSAASLSSYLPRMVSCAEQLTNRLEARVAETDVAEAKNEVKEGGGSAYRGVRVDIWRELGAMTLQVVGSTAYGVDFRAMDSEGEEAEAEAEVPVTALTELYGNGAKFGRALVEACRDVFRYSSIMNGSKYSRINMLLPELRPLLLAAAQAFPDVPFAKLLRARCILLNACKSLIDDWKLAAPHMTVEDHTAATTATASTDSSSVPPAVAVGSFLGRILSTRNRSSGLGLSDLQVVAQVQTFILAGYETTANGLAFAVYCIALNPEVESRLLAEIDSVLGSDHPPTEYDLTQLPYTEAVFNEALRLYPPAHVTTRSGENLQVGGYSIPRGTSIFLSIFSSHHNPDVWPRAEEFIPERFLPDSPLYPDVCARVPFAYAPFGYGSRMCIGWKFAVQEAKVALARMYQRLRFELEPGQVPLQTAVGITLAPRNGVWVRPYRRHRGAPPAAISTVTSNLASEAGPTPAAEGDQKSPP